MRIYVCWSTVPKYLFHEHPCGIAHKAVVDAGYEPEVVKARGWAKLPDALNDTAARKEVEQLTGRREVPVLVLDDGTAIAGSREIVAWAEANPAAPSPPA
jgi:hypothetical protein